MSYPGLYLKKNEDRRIRNGHLWVFSNEVDTQKSPLTAFKAGELVNVLASNGKHLATAYINPNCLICARLLSKSEDLVVDIGFFRSRLKTALALRETLFAKPFYRLVYGESDGLPGLVIDRFGPVFSVQITTAGIEARKALLLAALCELFSPSAIVLKNDNSQRELEGLSLGNEIVFGHLPDNLVIEENHAKFEIDVLGGQKTGWFYDHRMSRAYLASFAKGLKILDLFSYTGAWAIPAALADASEVVCVDSSEPALRMAQHNAELNNVTGKIKTVHSDVFEFLKQVRQQAQVFDIIILDPPALIKRKKDFKQGYEAYRRLNQLAMQLLATNGILVSASCSFHLSSDNLHDILRSAAVHTGKHLTFFANGGQAGDHPILPAMPETGYLKTFFCSVSSGL